MVDLQVARPTACCSHPGYGADTDREALGDFGLGEEGRHRRRAPVAGRRIPTAVPDGRGHNSTQLSTGVMYSLSQSRIWLGIWRLAVQEIREICRRGSRLGHHVANPGHRLRHRAACCPISLASFTNILASVGLLPSGNAPAIDYKARANARTSVRSLAAIAVRSNRGLRDGRRDPGQHFESQPNVIGKFLIE